VWQFVNQQQCETSEFRLPDLRASLLKFCNGLNATSVDFALDGCLQNLEWIMVDDDLATDMAERMGRSDPAVRARQFLVEFCDELGLEPKRLFKRMLHLEHVTRSLMGTHCLFKLKLGAAELDENWLVVHLDNDLNVVMLTATYQSLPPTGQTSAQAGGIAFGLGVEGAGPSAQGMEKSLVYDEEDWQELLRNLRPSLEDHFRSTQQTIIGATVTSRLWWPDWQQQRYVPVLQVKAQVAREPAAHGSATGSEYVVHVGKVDDKVKVLDSQLRAAGATQGQLKWGKVFARPWSGREKPPEGRTVLLRDLVDTSLGLVGTYAHVIDLLSPHWVADQTDFASDTSFTLFDRVMAYFHVDLMQRYFRGLGLFALDDCPQLMPLKTILQELRETDSSQYGSNSQSIQIRRLIWEGKTSLFTDARDPMVIYHETVHAITDALARLRRSDPMGWHKPRHLKFVQASAMDEGFADYFACALAEQQGAACPIVGTLALVEDVDSNDPQLAWTPRRRLEGNPKSNSPAARDRARRQVARQIGFVFDKQQGYFDNASDLYIQTTIERWGNYWARFLWQIRKELGAAIADVLIAHSLFFLTRWSDFRLGVAALIMADRLLFGGNHRTKIIAISGIDQRWRRAHDPVAIDDLDYSRWIHIGTV
jgi:hypothetical protein